MESEHVLSACPGVSACLCAAVSMRLLCVVVDHWRASRVCADDDDDDEDDLYWAWRGVHTI